MAENPAEQTSSQSQGAEKKKKGRLVFEGTWKRKQKNGEKRVDPHVSEHSALPHPPHPWNPTTGDRIK